MLNKNNVIIIAEAGVNHNGDINLAYKLIDEAKHAGADVVKFQSFNANDLTSKKAQMAEYQKQNIGKEMSQIEMLNNLMLKQSDFIKLYEYCKKIGIVFLSTPFDIENIKFLDGIDMPFWKIPSSEITDFPYLEAIGKTKKDVVMSTGMSTVKEINEAIEILKNNGTNNICLLHCNTEYPTPFEDVNLNAMLGIKNYFNLDVGYSDHTKGVEVPIAAVALGAKIIEKHFTLDRNMNGPDHKASLEPQELKYMIGCIRNIEKSLGNGNKEPSNSEIKNIKIARKSIVAKTNIKTGEIFTIDNITTKRPGNGISPMKWNEVLGKKAKRNFLEDDLIEL